MSETKAWKDSLQRVQAANADAQREGKKRREAHEKHMAKMRASTHTKGTVTEIFR
jgi:hypothetical protein